MAVYRLMSREFSRIWRRCKNYREKEIRYLARKRDLEIRDRDRMLQVYDPKTKKVVANFQEVVQNELVTGIGERTQMFAALKFGLFIFIALATFGQTYQEKVVAAVLMGEAWGEGARGMTAVAEVINQRCEDWRKTPMQVVTARVGRVHAFSCMNNTSPARLVAKYQAEPAYQTALKVAVITCRTPEKLPGITQHATHFTRLLERPWWAKKKKVTVVIGNHNFYRMARY